MSSFPSALRTKIKEISLRWVVVKLFAFNESSVTDLLRLKTAKNQEQSAQTQPFLYIFRKTIRHLIRRTISVKPREKKFERYVFIWKRNRGRFLRKKNGEKYDKKLGKKKVERSGCFYRGRTGDRKERFLFETGVYSESRAHSRT